MRDIADSLALLSGALERHAREGLSVPPDTALQIARLLAAHAALLGQVQPVIAGPNVIHVDFIRQPPDGGNAA